MKKDKLVNLYKQYSASSLTHLAPHAKERIKERVFHNLHTAPARKIKHARIAHIWSFWVVRFTSAAVLVLAVLSGTAYASGSSLPGDALYTVKRAVEGARLSLASTPESKAKLQVLFTEERIHELDTIEAQLPDPKKAAKKITLPLPQTPAATSLPAATTTVTIEPSTKTETAEHSEAEAKARSEVLKAITKLEQTQRALNRQGKQGQAKDLDSTITDFKNKINVRSWRDDRQSDSNSDTPQNKAEQESEAESIDENRSNSERGRRSIFPSKRTK